jgi:glutamate N-acetyltransferase/amino-acid N-acetyltransferase
MSLAKGDLNMQGIENGENSSGCVDVPGFLAAGVHCDVRNKSDGRLDLALIFSEQPCTLAGVFTRNRMAAAPVRLCRKVLSSGRPVRGVVVNSGNANACTGSQGDTDACRMQVAAAGKLGVEPGEILVCSTGRIGEFLPMGRIVEGIAEAAQCLSGESESGLRAADAILTSDTRRKICTSVVETSSGKIHVSGMAKGAGMIEPNMATMLAFLCTDAAVAQADLQDLLKSAVDRSFNSITVDGDESTNDTVLLLANGSSGIALTPNSADWEAFTQSVQAVCDNLARKIVGDGEKITKVVDVCIEGAATEEDASLAARAIANSLLVKSSWYGNDPNWGRLMDALGYSGAALSEQSVQLWYSADEQAKRVPVFSKGHTYRENRQGWKEIVSRKAFRIVVHLGHGTAGCRVWSTDLTEGYVNFNKSE